MRKKLYICIYYLHNIQRNLTIRTNKFVNKYKFRTIAPYNIKDINNDRYLCAYFILYCALQTFVLSSNNSPFQHKLYTHNKYLLNAAVYMGISEK